MTTLHPFAIGTLSAAVLALSLSGCGKQQDAHAASPQAPQAAPVSVAEVITRQVTQERSFSGVIEAIERAQLRPRVAGTVEQVRLQAGALVRKGDVLFVIDPRPYQADVARLEAAAAERHMDRRHAGACEKSLGGQMRRRANAQQVVVADGGKQGVAGQRLRLRGDVDLMAAQQLLRSDLVADLVPAGGLLVALPHQVMEFRT